MLFTEFRFWAFFAGVFALYAALPHRLQNRMLLVASYVFYGAWDWRFLGLILLSTMVDYYAAMRMDADPGPGRRRWLYLSLAVNLGVLGLFKYLGFFVGSFMDLMGALGLPAHEATLSIILPVGISFYTFQTLSYTIDVHRREMAPVRDFLDFALYVAFFPQLVAGPIERAKRLLPAIQAPRVITAEGVGSGAVLCLTGLIKKVVIADGVAPTVDAVFARPDPSGAEVALGAALFAVQIYGDFSGYTDIARGVARMLGFDLMRNFAQPYFAANPQEFWRRWHISLSTWLRDYLYVSLGGNRGGAGATYRNLMATMTLGGLWHGAAWNFVLWGVYQGGLLVVHRALFGRSAAAARGLSRIAAAALMFPVVCYGWLLFRAQSLEQIGVMSAALVTPAGFWSVAVAAPPLAAQMGIAALLIWDLAQERWGEGCLARLPLWFRAGLYAGLVYFLAFGARTTSAQFIYFQF